MLLIQLDLFAECFVLMLTYILQAFIVRFCNNLLLSYPIISFLSLFHQQSFLIISCYLLKLTSVFLNPMVNHLDDGL